MVQLETQSTQTEQGKDAPIFDSATDEEFERFFAKSAIKTQRTTPTTKSEEFQLKSDTISNGMLNIDVNKIREDGEPYQKFLDVIHNPYTLRHYKGTLTKFLGELPPKLYSDLGHVAPNDAVESRAKCFVNLCREDPRAGTNIIAEYIKCLLQVADQGLLNYNTIRNPPKAIKVLLDANDVMLHWKRLYRMYPRFVVSQDRAYTREELQKMMKMTHNLVDRVIITMFSSAGFRVESWDYFTWKDVTFFRNEDGSFRGAALLVYRGDPESYWTFITPEACEYLSLYREKWKTAMGVYPKPDDPLLKGTTAVRIKRLRQKGIRNRVTVVAEEAGLRPPLPPGRRRHSVMLDHGFRKYFNTMLRRAKVNYLDKEDMMGHKVGLEKNYERYVEEDFERFPEYEKAIPFLTISDDDRLRKDVKEYKAKIVQIQKEQNAEVGQKVQYVEDLHELAKIVKVSGLMKVLKKTRVCDTCSFAYVGEQCTHCA